MNRLSLFFGAVVLSAVAACGNEGRAVEPPVSVPADLQITFNGRDFGGQTIHAIATSPLQISARVVDRAGLEMTGDYAVEFISRDTSVLRVDANGLITARKPASGLVVARLPLRQGALTDSISFTFACDASLLFGLGVELRDSISNEMTSVVSGWRIRDIAGSFADSGRTTGLILTAPERAGTFRVDVSTPGYRDWTADNVVVTRDQCHVIPVALKARLQRTL